MRLAHRTPKFSLIITAIASLCAFPTMTALGVEFVQPGGTGNLYLPIENAPDSVVDMAGVRVTVKVVPEERAGDFVVNTGESVLGPVSILKGSARTFSVKYTIRPGALEGAFDVILLATMTTPGPLSTLGTMDAEGNLRYTPVNIIRKRPQSLDEPA